MKKKLMYLIMFLALVGASMNSRQDNGASSQKAVKLSSSKMTLVKGVNKTKTITLKNKKYNKVSKVTWKSSKKSVATVNKNGKVAVKKAGKTTITASAKVNGKKKTYKCVVTVKNLKDMKLSQSSVTLDKGKAKTLSMKNVGINKSKLKWSSSDKKVATVNKSGKVVAKDKGTATISAWIDGKKDTTLRTCKVTVNAKAEDGSSSKDDNSDKKDDEQDDDEEPQEGTTEQKSEDGKFSVTITAPTSSLKANGTHDFNVTISNNKIASDQKITWITSGDKYIGEINDKNIFTAIDVDGEMTVSCHVRGKDKDGKTVSCRSNSVQVKVETGYTYEMFALSNFYNSPYYMDGGVSGGDGAVYIETNRTDLTDEDCKKMWFALINEGKIINALTPMTLHRYCNIVGYTEEYQWYGSALGLDKCKISNGFTAMVEVGGPTYEYLPNSDIMPSGDYTLALVKDTPSGDFAILTTLPIKVYDSDQLFKDWAQYFLDNYTTPNMTNHEKMMAMVEFMDSYYYSDSSGTTHAMGLSYISGCGGSVNTPNVLCRFGREILGYSELVQDAGYHGEVLVWKDADTRVPLYRYYVINGVESTLDSHNRKVAGFQTDTLQDLINIYGNQELYKVYEDVTHRAGTNLPPK